MVTVDQIQADVAGVVDQDSDTSNISTDDYALRLNYINKRERMWSEVGKWKVLYNEYNTLTSTASGNNAVPLPSNFRLEASFPKITYDGVSTKDFTIVRPQELSQRNASDQYVSIQGNSTSGFTMTVHPATNSGFMASGASIMVSYFSSPSSLASPANVVICPNPQYIVAGVIADIWESREDARFTGKKAEADSLLANMIEFETTPSEAAADDSVRSIEKTRNSFRWGQA